MNISHPDEAHLPRLPDSVDQPITAMPQSKMKKLHFRQAQHQIYPDKGLRTVLQSRRPKTNRPIIER
ncbi:hypothetical protein TNCV_3253191 [Trichonephila clavipes]|nr:hypothetical protein TNCV_3253191 [Trichonephila clavipes]